jgi:DNA anti-recombination protein RmuC
LRTRRNNKTVKRASDTQETLERIEQLLAESKRLQQEHAALSKKLKDLIQRTEQA